MYEYFLEDAGLISILASTSHPLNGQGLRMYLSIEVGALLMGQNF